MSESIKFRSSVNGFNRSEVIHYIENLLKEKEELLSRAERLEAECKLKSEEAEAARRELEAEKKKCDGCDVARKAEANLGATMLEAKRFSESLVREAEERSEAVISAASLKASAAAVSVGKISDKLGETLTKCNDAVSEVKAAVDGIKTMLEDFDVYMAEGHGIETENACGKENAPTNAPSETPKTDREVPTAADKDETVSAAEKNKMLAKAFAYAFGDEPYISLADGDDGKTDIFTSSEGTNKFGVKPSAAKNADETKEKKTETAADNAEKTSADTVDDDFEPIVNDVRVPMFAEDDETDDEKNDKDTKTQSESSEKGFSPDFSFEDDGFTIKVDFDD